MNNKITFSVEKSIKILKQQGVILYPTDTVWGIGCDVFCSKAIEKIFQIKQRNQEKNFIILVNSVSMLKKYVEITSEIEKWLEKIERPTTVIYNNPKNLPKNIIAKNNTVAIRIVNNNFCQKLIENLGNPIVSTSANISGEPTPLFFSEINKKIIESVDFVVPYQQSSSEKSYPSQLVKIEKTGEIVIIRE